MPTMGDLEVARRELSEWHVRFENYSGNNPDKYRAQIKDAERKVRSIEARLKASGQMPLSEHEQVEAELDRAFPNAKSREIVEHHGRRYQRRFFPVERSRSRKTVTEWGREWIELKRV